MVSIAFPLSPSISRCFSIHSSPVIGFHSCFFCTTDVFAPIRSTLHLLMESFQAWDCHGSGTRCCGSRGGEWCAHEAVISFQISALAMARGLNLADLAV